MQIEYLFLSLYTQKGPGLRPKQEEVWEAIKATNKTKQHNKGFMCTNLLKQNIR